MSLPGGLAGSYGVILIYRGYWCPFCNEQMAAFASATEALAEAGIKVVAFSVDDEVATADSSRSIIFRSRWGIPPRSKRWFPRPGPTTCRLRGHFLETTRFVLAPDGTIVNAVYSSRAIGRLFRAM